MASAVVDRAVFQVEYFDGIQFVLRVAHAVSGDRFIVYDRYDDGLESLIRRRVNGQMQTTFSQTECVRLLDEVVY